VGIRKKYCWYADICQIEYEETTFFENRTFPRLQIRTLLRLTILSESERLKFLWICD